ncbi:MAG: hypothetical protein WC600_05585 [Desulfobaccales bacterium]
MMKLKKHLVFLLVAAALAFLPVSGQAVTIDPFYAGSYTAFDLGSVPGVPPLYGPVLLKAGDPNTLLIGGNANEASGALYSIGVTRDANNHITGFSGSASFYAEAAYNDGGAQYGPGGVLFLARWPVNEIGQNLPGSTVTDKIVDMAALGVANSAAALAFVPAGFPGAGQLKLVSWEGGEWYTLTYTPDGTGTFDITSANFVETLPGGPEGIAYVPPGSPLFPVPSLLQCEFSVGKVATYEVDANGDPTLASRRDFITDLEGAEGAFIDPLTGDFLFSTFGGGDRVVVVQGFVAPPVIPLPPTVLLLGSGLLGLIGFGRKFKTT